MGKAVKSCDIVRMGREGYRAFIFDIASHSLTLHFSDRGLISFATISYPPSTSTNMAHPKAVRFIRFSIQYSSIALLYYDYALTWPREVKYFWNKKPTASTALYIACRYAMVANVLYTFALAEKLPTMSCDGGYQVCAALSVIGRAAIIVVWGARTYAVFNRNRYVLALFGSLGLLVIILSAMHVPYVACNGSRGKPPSPGLLSIFTVVYEVLSALFNTVRSYQALRVGGSWKTQRQGLTYLVMEQGLLYFGFVTAFSIASLILNNVRLLFAAGSFLQRLLNALTLPLSGMMTARFLLHLREWEYKSTHSVHDGSHHENYGGAPIQFKRTERNSTHWSITDEFGEDPVLRAERNLGVIPASRSGTV
ncbi:hypothetical protein B0H34DRAFT_709679 [Crassisporium funariophilum]|nr:hypothetical protein B0H34DRAFT_709679 [Crassisporium funariophilum]